MTYTRTVGEGRVNLVVNQEELTCLRDGDVLLPGTGVVVSVERETGLKWINECGFTPKEEGYYDLRGARFDLSLERPDELDEATWRGMAWAYGGGLTLIRDGKPVFEPGIDAGESLRREGWTSPLSAQTQESDIVAMHRHPRTAVGVTKGGSLFILVFNGRSPMSVGANYNEICAICRKMVPDVKELMNVDGGGSSVLGFSVGNRFMEDSWPSTSFDSVVGMVRPVNSTLNVVVAR